MFNEINNRIKLKILILTGILTTGISFQLFPQNNFNSFRAYEGKSLLKNFSLRKVEYPGDSAIDVTYYKLDLTIKYKPNFLTGIVTVNAKSNSLSLQSFFLDLQDTLVVDSVVLSTGKKLSFNHSNAKLNITLDTVYNPGQQFSIKIYYQGVPGSSGFGSFEFGSHNNKPVIWSLSEPYGASDWWPSKDTPADKADSSDVWITCDTSLTGVSNGILQTTVDNGDGTHTFKWKNSYPIAQYLISIAVSNYTRYTIYYKYSERDSMPVVNYIYPENFDSVKSDLDETVNMLKVFSLRYEQYPFIKEKYGQVQFGWNGGMEHQTITSLGAFGTYIQAHELSHQWFGDKVTSRDWQDIWLNEGFATYSEAVYAEATGGVGAYNNYMQGLFQRAKSAKGSVYVEDISSVGNIFDGARSYAKGAVVLHMLRGIVGDSTFFQILRTYLDDPKLAYGTATTDDFEADAKKVYKQRLDYFFNEWIYGENYPKYNISWNFTKNSNNTSTINLHITQRLNTNPAYFTMPLKIKVSTSLGDTVVTVLNNMQDQVIPITVNGTVKFISFDPNGQLLNDISLIDSIDLTKPSSFSLEQNYPDPFNPYTNIKYTIPVLSKGVVHVSLDVYDIVGRKVAALVNEDQSANEYSVQFPPKDKVNNFASGIYIYTLRAGSYFSAKKMLLLK